MGFGDHHALVTGSAGFIGLHCCNRLLRDGYSVICIDNLSTRCKDRICHLMNYQGFRLILHDVTIPFSANVNEIFNLACTASPVQYQIDPIHTLKTCVLGSLNVLDIAKRHRAKILQASTSEVYGNPDTHPQKETYLGCVNPVGVRACYDEGKRASEALFFDYYRKHQVRIKVARIFNTYGPGMHPDDGRVVSHFIVQALKSDPLTIYGDGRQTRAFCYIADLTEALMRLMRSPDACLGPINLGNAAESTILALAETILELTGSRSQLVLRPLPSDDPVRRRPDLTRAERELDWRPQVPLKDGLSRTIEYFDDLLTTQAYNRDRISGFGEYCGRLAPGRSTGECVWVTGGVGCPGSHVCNASARTGLRWMGHAWAAQRGPLEGAGSADASAFWRVMHRVAVVAHLAAHAVSRGTPISMPSSTRLGAGAQGARRQNSRRRPPLSIDACADPAAWG